MENGAANGFPAGGTDDSSLALARLTPATAGDHHAIFEFLSTVFRSPSRDAFLTSLDEPFYEPSDRLLVKCGPHILAHAHATKRVMRFGSLSFPVAGLNGLATLPEFRGQGYAGKLLEAIQRQMVDDGAVVGLLRTSVPHFFRAAGWAVCGRHSHYRARTRDVLSQLVSHESEDAAHAISVRPWRQVELPALMRLYARHTARAVGAYDRSEAYWRWLVSRKQFDQIFVAVDGPDRQDLDDHSSPIVGYAVTREDQIVEIVAAPEHPIAARRLLARACGEAVERDYHTVVFHAPPDEPLNAVMAQAGGSQHLHEAYLGEVFMAKIFEPLSFLKMLLPLLHERAEEARLARPCELGLLVQGSKRRLTVTRRSVKLVREKLGRSYLSMNDAEFTRLLLGHLELDEAVSGGRLETSTRVALELARILFPRLPFWRSPLDDGWE